MTTPMFRSHPTGTRASLLAALSVATAFPAHSADGVVEAVGSGRPIIDLAARYEHVSQAGFEEDADAPVVRARLGYETGEWQGLKLLFDFDVLRAVVSDYDSTINGKTQYPVVVEPEGEELNQLKLSYSGLPDTSVDLGRQRIVFDNARFIGNVVWRLNEQTYDALYLTNTSIDGLTVRYAYLDKVHRIFGDDSPQGNWRSDSHILNASYTGLANTTITAYAYLLDLQPDAMSTATYGIRAVGKVPAGPLTIGYTGEYARQVDRAGNPNDFGLDFYLVSASLGAAGLTGSVSYEVLSGNGTVGFSTPLATLHAFQGWADVFLTTPETGIKDLYGQIAYQTGPLSLAAIYHNFKADFGPGSLGSEFDAIVTYKFSPNLSGLVKYANYDGPQNGPASRTKTWVGINYQY